VCRRCQGARGPLVGVDRRIGIHHACALETIAQGVVEEPTEAAPPPATGSAARSRPPVGPNPTRRLAGGTNCAACGRLLDLAERDAGHCQRGCQATAESA
jgi:hypothetical protein